MLLATVIETQALLETCLAALVAGVGVALTFSLAILGTTRFSEAQRDGHRLEAAAFATLGVLGFAATGAAIAFGIIVVAS
jgi:hypothetical protein